MNTPSQILLEEKDIKKLKGKKRFMLIFLVFISFISLGMAGLVCWMYYTDGDAVLAKLIGAGTVFGFIAVIFLYIQWKNLKADYINGFKEVIQGQITKKYSHKANHELTIHGKEYRVNDKEYERFEISDNVLIAYAPKSKIILDIKKLLI